MVKSIALFHLNLLNSNKYVYFKLVFSIMKFTLRFCPRIGFELLFLFLLSKKRENLCDIHGSYYFYLPLRIEMKMFLWFAFSSNLEELQIIMVVVTLQKFKHD